MSHILLVDDEEILRRAAARMLERAQHTVTQAGCAKDAIAAARNGPAIDVLVTDLKLRETDGECMVATLREEIPYFSGKKVPVVYISEYQAEDLKHRLGNNEYFLEKPFTMASLTAVVNQATH